MWGLGFRILKYGPLGFVGYVRGIRFPPLRAHIKGPCTYPKTHFPQICVKDSKNTNLSLLNAYVLQNAGFCSISAALTVVLTEC